MLDAPPTTDLLAAVEAWQAHRTLQARHGVPIPRNETAPDAEWHREPA
jgi:hypothetical protein